MIRAMMAALVLALAGTVHASDQAAANLVKVLSGINSMQAEFAQRTTDARGRGLPVQSGLMSVKRPGLFRWEVQKPDNQLVLTTGKVLWIYDPDLMQATRQTLSDQVGNTPALLLSGDPRKLSQAFVISEEKAEAAGEQLFVLRPRAKDALFEDLRVRFRGGAMVQMELGDSLGQRTEIVFTGVRLNPVFPARHFDFVPPKGVDVIDQL